MPKQTKLGLLRPLWAGSDGRTWGEEAQSDHEENPRAGKRPQAGGSGVERQSR
jgi:hypothetical protein